MEIIQALKEIGSPIELITASILFYLAWRVYISSRKFIDSQKNEFDGAIKKMLLKEDFEDWKNDLNEFKRDITEQIRQQAAMLNQIIGRIDLINKK